MMKKIVLITITMLAFVYAMASPNVIEVNRFLGSSTSERLWQILDVPVEIYNPGDVKQIESADGTVRFFCMKPIDKTMPVECKLTISRFIGSTANTNPFILRFMDEGRKIYDSLNTSQLGAVRKEFRSEEDSFLLACGRSRSMYCAHIIEHANCVRDYDYCEIKLF